MHAHYLRRRRDGFEICGRFRAGAVDVITPPRPLVFVRIRPLIPVHRTIGISSRSRDDARRCRASVEDGGRWIDAVAHLLMHAAA
jgi:hypothetical protein